MINSGSLRHRIEIYREEVVSEGPNGTITDFVLQQERWGRVIPISVESQAKYQQAGYSEVSNKILFRNVPDIKLSDRIKWINGRDNPEYQIASPPRVQDGKFRNSTIIVKTVPNAVEREV